MGNRCIRLISIWAIASTSPLCADIADDSTQRKSFVIWRTDRPPVIDGVYDSSEWARASIIDDFIQSDPVYGESPTESTVVRVTFDDDYLYVLAQMSDSDPSSIRASQMIQGKPFFSDDRFYLMLDSFNSKRNDYFFQVNPNGIRRDALRENNSRFIDEWSTIWHAESTIHEHGWVAEMAIPFKSVSFDTGSDTWGINFGRGIMSKQEFILWSSHERQDWPAYGGEVRGLEGMEQGLGLDIVPSVSLSERRDLVLDESSGHFEPSLDLRYRITPSLTGTLTVNTDFSTAEVDDQQIALDRFSLFFPEKRDFFLQDAGIFEFGNIDTNGRPFFSRRIGLSGEGEPIGIEYGAKLTGRAGRFNIGALAIRQEAHGDQQAKNLVVARGSMNVLDESTVGFIFTDGDPASNESNSLKGLDFLYRNTNGPWGQIVTGNFWAQQSDSPGLVGDDLAFGALLSMPNDRFNAYLSGQEIQENFNPALGFVNRSGIRRYEAGFRYRQRPEDSHWRALNYRIDYSQVTDLDGNTLSGRARIRPVGLFSHDGDWWAIDLERNREVVLEAFDLFDRLHVPAGEYEFDRVRAEVFTAQQRPLSVGLSIQKGGFFGGDRLEKYFEVQWRQSAHFSMAAIFEENVVDLPSGSFTSHLASLRTDVAFNSRWSWSNLFQYNNTDDVFGLNSRLRFIPEAGREMILVFNHNADVGIGNRLHSTGNDLNLKISYTFRY
jgi:hypothetical protein